MAQDKRFSGGCANESLGQARAVEDSMFDLFNSYANQKSIAYSSRDSVDLGSGNFISADHCRLCSAALRLEGRLHLDPAPAAAWSFAAGADGGGDGSGRLDIAACERCGLVQRVGTPVAGYRTVNTVALYSPAMRIHRRSQAEAFIQHHDLAGQRVVEVGTGRGELLVELATLGVQAEGLEAGGAPLDAVTGVKIHDGYPGELPPAGAPWSAAWCLNFLEHAPDPVGFLRGIADLLAPDAPLLVEVPDYRQQQRLGRAFDYVADHLSYFTESTLELALTIGGFTPTRINVIRGGENLECWARVRRPVSLACEADRIARTRAALVDALVDARATAGRTAIWGASHQALLVLAGVSPSLVDMVIDSSPLKQGRYTPVGRVPIVAPGTEELRSVALVVIIASGYEAEIAAQLQALGFKGRVQRLVGESVGNVG
jgi:hypothetical protein